MTLAFVSTKREEARTRGRFGIGLKTLRRLGTTLSVHCGPYPASISGLIRSLSRFPVRSAESASSFIARPTSTYCESTSTATTSGSVCGLRLLHDHSAPAASGPAGQAGEA